MLDSLFIEEAYVASRYNDMNVAPQGTAGIGIEGANYKECDVVKSWRVS